MDSSPKFDPDNFHGCSLIQSCGSGAYGEVWMAEEKLTGKRVAIKIISKDDAGRWRDELAGLINYRHVISSHPNLVEIYHVEENETYFYYSMELADNQDESCKTYRPDTLSNRLDKSCMKLETVLKIINPLLDGLETLHNSGLNHRDIKPGNIIFVRGVAKLSDVGLVSKLVHSSAGTPGFVPKEYNSGNSGTPGDNFKIDLYAMGKVIYCALTRLNAEDFPKLPDSMFTPALKPVNLFLLKACNEKSDDRFMNVVAFRQALKQSVARSDRTTFIQEIKVLITVKTSLLLGLICVTTSFFPSTGLLIGLACLIWGIRGVFNSSKELADCGVSADALTNHTTSNKAFKKARTSFILGLIGLFAWFIPVIGLPIAITGLIFGIKGLNRQDKKLAATGIALSLISLTAGVCNSAIGAYNGYNGKDPLINLIKDGKPGVGSTEAKQQVP